MNKSRDDIKAILEKYISNEALRNHCLMVADAMEAYAQKKNKSSEEVEQWWAAGALHDLDWEMYPEQHPRKAIEEILPKEGVNDSTILDAIAAHAPARTQKEPKTEIEKYLFACDELSGFINAVSLLRPTGFEGMKVKSVKKRLKSNSFAAGVDRDDVYKGAELIEESLEEHIEFLIDVFSG